MKDLKSKHKVQCTVCGKRLHIDSRVKTQDDIYFFARSMGWWTVPVEKEGKGFGKWYCTDCQM